MRTRRCQARLPSHERGEGVTGVCTLEGLILTPSCIPMTPPTWGPAWSTGLGGTEAPEVAEPTREHVGDSAGGSKELQSEPTSTWACDHAITDKGKCPCLIRSKLRPTEVPFKTQGQKRLMLRKLIAPAPVRNFPGPSSRPSNTGPPSRRRAPAVLPWLAYSLCSGHPL